DGRARLLRRAPDFWRLRLSEGLSGRTDLPRCPCLPDLRGHQRHPAHGHSAGPIGELELADESGEWRRTTRCDEDKDRHRERSEAIYDEGHRDSGSPRRFAPRKKLGSMTWPRPICGRPPPRKGSGSVLIRSLRPYVRPVNALAHERWPRWFPRQRFQTTVRPL